MMIMGTVAFDLDIYSESAIIATIQAFQNIVTVASCSKDNIMYCSLSKCCYDEEQTCHEFCNYALQLTIQGA